MRSAAVIMAIVALLAFAAFYVFGSGSHDGSETLPYPAIICPSSIPAGQPPLGGCPAGPSD